MHTLTPEQQEEINSEFFAQSEVMNCLEEARQLINNKNYKQLAIDAAEKGQVAAVISHSVYCKATDAFAGMQDCNYFSANSIDDIWAQIRQCYDMEYFHDEHSVDWYGDKPTKIIAVNDTIDEIPF